MKSAKGDLPPLQRECFIETTDSWYPNFDGYGRPDLGGKYVKLILVEFVDSDGYRVAVWGADDTGMERDFEGIELPSALELYALLAGGGPVSRSDLAAFEMVPA